MKALWLTYWLKLATPYDAMSGRERWMIAAAVLGGIVMFGQMLFIEPAATRAVQAERSIAEQRKQLDDLRMQLAALQSPGQDPDVAARAELDALKRKLGELGGRFAALEGALVPSERMPALLEDLVGRNSGLRLLSLRTLPVTPLLDKANAKASEGGAAADKTDKPAADAAGGLYKHGVEIRLEGGYQELTTYLARLEKSPQKLLWSSVSLSAEQHPKLLLTLTVFTLSLDRSWLVV